MLHPQAECMPTGHQRRKHDMKTKSKPLGKTTEKLKDKRPKARILGQNLSRVKALNPSKRLPDRRPGLTTSKATGG